MTCWLGVPAVARVERAEALDQPLVDRALRDLVGRAPPRRVGHPGNAVAVVRLAAGEAQDAVHPLQIVGMVPGTVVMLHLAGGYYLWFQFMVSFGKRVPAMPLYAAFLIPLLAVMALRLIAMASHPRGRTVEAC